MARKASANLARVADQLADLPEGTMGAAVKVVIGIAYDEARRATGDGRMSGVGRRGAKLRAVATRPTLRGTAVTVPVRGIPVGPWSMLSYGTDPHDIRPKMRGRGKNRKSGVMFGPKMDHAVSGVVHHKGTTGNLAWRKVIARAERDVLPEFRDAVHRAVS